LGTKRDSKPIDEMLVLFGNQQFLRQETGRLRALKLFVEDRSFHFLVDPGAVISMVKERVILKESWRSDYDWQDNRLTGITGHAIRFDQRAKIPFRFASQNESVFEHGCFVCNHDIQIPPGVDGLLGVDFFDRCE
jgi:hypothetical protein